MNVTVKPCGDCGGEGRLKGKSRCLPCLTKHRHDYYEANKPRWPEYHAKRDRAQKREYDKVWKKGEKNRATTRAYNAAYRKANPDYPAKWRVSNLQKCRSYTHRHRALKHAAFGSHTIKEWETIVASQGGKCNHCRRKTFLEQDHIIPISLGGSDMAVNIQGLCRSCNAAKAARITPGTQLGVFDRLSLFDSEVV